VAPAGGAITIPTDGHPLRSLLAAGSGRLRILADGEPVREVALGAEPEEIAVEGVRADRLRLAFDAPAVLRELALRRLPERHKLSIVPPDTAPFFEDVSALAEALTRNPRGAVLFLLGGEPFMIDEVWELARELIARGLGKRIILSMSTNGTRQREELAQLAPAFRHVVLHLSIDGYGPMFEYLRFGARWTDMLQTLKWLRSLPNMTLLAFPTIQNYNALDMVRLFRFLDAQGLPFGHNLLARPARLYLANLPPRVRRTAAARLRSYLDGDCRPKQRRVVRAYVDILESPTTAFDPVLFREFMLFTNDLDASRKQRFADAAPDLATLIAASGEVWTEDRHHA
jgi:hypothetical protein